MADLAITLLCFWLETLLTPGPRIAGNAVDPRGDDPTSAKTRYAFGAPPVAAPAGAV
jgi:hypothetical protein